MLNSLPKTIDRKITRKLRSHFHHINFVNMHSTRLGTAMRKSLRSSLGKFKIQFLGMMQESEARQSGLGQLRNALEGDAIWWEGLEGRILGIKSGIEAVNLDI